MTSVAVVMAGGNIHGRLLIEKLLEMHVEPRVIINEHHTERSKRLETFLKNDFYSPASLQDLDLNVQNVKDFASDEALSILREISPSYIINGGCGIFRENLLSIATCINVHPGMLPYFRGLDPVLWSLYYQKPIGATVHKISSGIDEGDIYLSKQLPWQGVGSVLELRLQCMSWGAELLGEFLKNPSDYTPRAQNESQARYFTKFPDENLRTVEENLKSYIPANGGNIFGL